MKDWREILVKEVGARAEAAIPTFGTPEATRQLRASVRDLSANWLRERIAGGLVSTDGGDPLLLQAHRGLAEPSVAVLEAYGSLGWGVSQIIQARIDGDDPPVTWSRLADQVMRAYVVQFCNGLSAVTELGLRGLHVQSLVVARQLVETLLRVVTLASDRDLFETWFFSGNAGVDFDEQLYNKQRRSQWEAAFRPAKAFSTFRAAAVRLLGKRGAEYVTSTRSYYDYLSAHVHSSDPAMWASAHPMESLGLTVDDDRYHVDPAGARWRPTAEFPLAMEELAKAAWCFWEFFPRLAMNEEGRSTMRDFPLDLDPRRPDEHAFCLVLLAMQNLVGRGGAISELLGWSSTGSAGQT